ncbi:uncharacterized protein VTP21DRAFT_5178 [Calcarisporiella thermophila]|uniref:uncharacterized protein n=1 Tax=Calcarisporiella thermophila TaxID=911321 RepID=UPI0037423917
MKSPILTTLTIVGIAVLSQGAPHNRRGILDNTLNNPDIIDHLSLIDSTVNSNPQTSENRNSNTKANGPGDNSDLSKQGGEGIYHKGHYKMRRGLIDNSLNNVHILDHLDMFNTIMNSDVEKDENTNANTKASGPGDNSAYSRKGPEGYYYRGGGADVYNPPIRYVAPAQYQQMNAVPVQMIPIGMAPVQMVPARMTPIQMVPARMSPTAMDTVEMDSDRGRYDPDAINNSMEPPNQDLTDVLGKKKRGLLDNTLNNADIIDHLSLIDSMVNSNPQDSENRNANTKASGPGDNSSLSKQGPEGAYIKKGTGH